MTRVPPQCGSIQTAAAAPSLREPEAGSGLDMLFVLQKDETPFPGLKCHRLAVPVTGDGGAIDRHAIGSTTGWRLASAPRASIARRFSFRSSAERGLTTLRAIFRPVHLQQYSTAELHLLNFVVGASKERFRDRETERSSGPKIDDQQEPGRLIEWDIIRFDTLQYLIVAQFPSPDPRDLDIPSSGSERTGGEGRQSMERRPRAGVLAPPGALWHLSNLACRNPPRTSCKPVAGGNRHLGIYPPRANAWRD